MTNSQTQSVGESRRHFLNKEASPTRSQLWDFANSLNDVVKSLDYYSM